MIQESPESVIGIAPLYQYLLYLPLDDSSVGTPTDFSGTGAPDSEFDTLYNFGELQPNKVATAGPGYAGYNGGRWQIHGLEFTDYAAALTQFDTNGSDDF